MGDETMICELSLDQKFQLLGIIADGLAAVGAIVAIFIALKANKQNREEMKMTSKIEERSANIAFLDKRLSIIQDIIDDKPVSDEILYVMFEAVDSKTNQELHKRIAHIKKLEELRDKAEQNIFLAGKPDGEGGYISTYQEEFEHLRKCISKGVANDEMRKRYKEICDKQAINVYPDVENKQGKGKLTPLYTIEEELEEEKEKYNKEKEKFVDMLKKYVRSGIQTIDEEVK